MQSSKAWQVWKRKTGTKIVADGYRYSNWIAYGLGSIILPSESNFLLYRIML